MPRTPFTVLILRPDYVASDFGHDTYLAHVDAVSPERAEEEARMEAWVADQSPQDEEGVGEPEDYHVLCVFPGHLSDLRTA